MRSIISMFGSCYKCPTSWACVENARDVVVCANLSSLLQQRVSLFWAIVLGIFLFWKEGAMDVYVRSKLSSLLFLCAVDFSSITHNL